jgi:8-oxo-dGTP pyrophosphatase MutT (NUDIX family)
MLVPRSSVCAIIQTLSQKFLLQMRDNRPEIWFPGYWGLFGGQIEKNETPIIGLKRELAEELNLQVEIDQINYFTKLVIDFEFAASHKIYRTYYAIVITDAQLESLELNEGAGMGLFEWSQVSDGLRVSPHDMYALWIFSNSEYITQ